MLQHPTRVVSAFDQLEPIGYFQRHESQGSNWFFVANEELNGHLEGMYKAALRGEASGVMDLVLSYIGAKPKDEVIILPEGAKMETVQKDAVKFEDNFHIWVAYHSDWSEMIVFRNEIDCLRYAVDNHMSVKKVVDCQSIRFDQIEEVPTPE